MDSPTAHSTGWIANMNVFARKTPIATRPIVFVHVPKTAGTAVTNYFENRFRSTGRIAPPFTGDYSIYGKKPDRWSLIAGHFTYSRIRALVPNADFFTFLREPVSRAISLYRSWRDPSKMTPQWRAVMTAEEISLFDWVYGASLEEFVLSDHPHIRRGLSNNMTTFLSSDGTADAASALRNLQHEFTAFGIQEAFDESLASMRRSWPWLGPYRLTSAHENRSQVDAGDVTTIARRRIEELNAVDLQFYDAARSLFHSRSAALRAA